MSDEAIGLRWGVEQRLAFLDACLFWAGRVNRSDLVRRFGVSIPQASADLARYAELAPGNARYDRNRKTYLTGADFHPVVNLPSANEVLEGLERAAGKGGVGERSPWAREVTVERAVPRTNRVVDDAVLRALLAAVRERQLIRVKYQSFSRPEASLRWIAPHAFADDGDRWHVRAYCATNHDFRDFVVSRIQQVAETRDSPVSSDADRGWYSVATIRLAPNPKLEDSAKRALEVEHRMVGGTMELTVRTCFVYYVRRRLWLDLDDNYLPPRRKQLVLVNAAQVARSEEEADADTKAALANVPKLDEMTCGESGPTDAGPDPVSAGGGTTI